MTFSDSRIVKALQADWTPVWESVSPVSEVTFELGEGRSVKGTVGGEIAIYFCDEQGKVFDILPALQSPAATLEAMDKALGFYKAQNGKIEAPEVVSFHRERMRQHLARVYKEHPERFHAPQVPSKPPEQVQAQSIYPATAENEAHRQRVINTALDDATRDMRFMVASKVAVASPRSEPITVVEPGGRDYYRWQVGQAFCGIVPDREKLIKRVTVGISIEEAVAPQTSNAPRRSAPAPHPLYYWRSTLKEPKQWERLLFEGILYQPLGGGKSVYDSDSLKAMSIIED